METKWICISAFLLAGFMCLAGAQHTDPFDDKLTVNGLTVIVRPLRATEIVSLQLFLRGGSMNLTESTQGIESLCFESALKGNTLYPAEKLNSILDKTGAELSTSSERDFSCISLRCLKQDFDTLWSIFADLILHPAFESDDVEIVRNNLLLGIKQRKDSPPRYINRLADEVFYEGHPYRFDPAGVERTVSAITIEQMKQYLRDNLIGTKLLIVVVGNVIEESVRKKAESTFGKLPRGEYTDVFPQPVNRKSPSVKFVAQELSTNYVRGTFAMPGPRDPDYHAALVMTNILRTRVFDALMRERSLSYGPSVGLEEDFANCGHFSFTSSFPDCAVKVVIDELKRLQNEPVSAKDLKDRVAIFLNEYNLRLETNQSIGRFLARYELAGSDWRESARFIEQIRNITDADIKRVAHKYFRNMQTVIIGNPKRVNKDNYLF